MAKHGSTPDREINEALPVFSQPLTDFVMFDGDQERLFAAIGRARSPFAGAAQWLWLEEVLAERSRQMLGEVGEDEWRRRGGTYDSATGEPIFRKNAPIVREIVQEIAAENGGLLYRDSRGVGWAVRLLSGPGSDETRIGIGISWDGNPLLADSDKRDESIEAIEQQLREEPRSEALDRQRLEQLASRIRLYSRAEQLLWLIYAEVRRQRSSVVIMSDETLAGAIWGGSKRPQNWRQDIFEILASLSGLHIEMLRITRGGWSPRPDLRSVAVASVQRLEPTTSGGTCDREGCPLKGQNVRHGHFIIQVGRGFLGVLENYAIEGPEGQRSFDFSKTSSDEAKRRLHQARKQGQLKTVNLPAKVFGPAKWSELSSRQGAIIQALIREITRPVGRKPKQEEVREDGADIIHGNRVPGGIAKRNVVCGILEATGSYVAFNGNGKRRGLGYRIVGHKGTGWLAKCGYEVSGDRKALRGVVRQFLADLRVVAGILGLTVVGYSRTGKRWIGLEQLRAIAKRRNGIAQLEDYQLRIYGPPDYQDRLRGYFEERGQMRIVRPDAFPEIIMEGSACQDSLELRQRMDRLGVTHRALADHLGYSQPFVTQMLGGDRPWPEGTYERAEEYLRQLEAQGSE